MPNYRVQTDSGTYIINLDKAPSDPEARDRAFKDAIASGSAKPDVSFSQRAVSAVADPLKAGLSRLVQGAVNAGTAQAAPTALPQMGMMPSTTPMSNSVANVAVPSTPSQVLGMGATLATAPFTGGMSLPAAAAMRTGAAMAGSGLGAMLEGQSPSEMMTTSGLTGLTTAVMETAGWGIGKIARSAHGARNLINKNEWDQMADEVGKYVPDIFKAKNQSELKKKIMSGEALRTASDRYGEAIEKVDDLIGNNQINVPSLFRDPDTGQAMPASLETVLRRLSEIGDKGFGGSKGVPIKRTVKGKPDRETWEEAIGEIVAELDRFNPTKEASTALLAARKEYALTRFWHGALEKADTWHGGPNIVEINFNKIRDYFDANLSRLRTMLPKSDLERLDVQLHRGGPFGSRDVMPSGFGAAGDAAAQLLRTGGGTGTVGVLAPRTALPNVGAQYTGTPPFTAGQGPVTLMDLIGQAVSPSVTGRRQ